MDNIKIKTIYYIYILECTNNILYTGVTTDYKRRFYEHSGLDGSKKGAKFTKGHKPLGYVALWKTGTRSDAQKLEARIKQLDKSEKELLIANNRYFKTYFEELLDIENYSKVRLSNIKYK